jgi:predicted DsbA family dithiol-disulfide isomerase
MTKHMKIDFVSDVSCPWCVIGLRGLEEALDRAGDAVTAELHFQPFELNPDMPPEGQNLVEHITRKYGITEAQSAENRQMIADRAASLGFTMARDENSRIWNTFDAHRLLHWAGLVGRQRELKHALFEAYFTQGKSPGDHAVLLEAATKAGLDPTETQAILASDRYADDVRRAEEIWRRNGINAVPAVIINDRYLISGGQPPDAFERALRQIAAES